MKVTVDLGDTWVYDLDQSLASVIKEELSVAVKSEIRKMIKERMEARKKDIRAAVDKAVSGFKVNVGE